MAETFSFSADIHQLMSLIINTFYSNKDVFLRELISNASDALDKYRYKSLQARQSAETPHSSDDEEEVAEIKIVSSKSDKMLYIFDSGVGMSKSELIENLGTIAHSGTRRFMEAVQAGADVSMIGQFGVGFYSAFLVADEVRVYSKNVDSSDVHVWSSQAGGTFSVDVVSNAEQVLPVSIKNHGTVLALCLKSDQLELLEDSKIRTLVKRHNEFVQYPISLLVEKSVEKEVESQNIEEEMDDDDVKVEDVTDEKDESASGKNIKKQTVVEKSWDQLNTIKPVWMQSESELSETDYFQFYKQISNDWENPIAWKHLHIEGKIDFRALLFIPQRAPYDLFDSKKKTSNIQLYVRRVFIMDKCENILPDYLQFVRGVVDSEDMPLNISREMLQQNRIIQVINKNLTKKILEMLEKLSEDDEKYKVFYTNFSKNIKLGIHEDNMNRDRLVNLLRFSSSAESNVSFKQYVSRMKSGQKSIYYMSGETLEQIEKSPFVESAKRRGYEVLFMTDPMDEYAFQQVQEYEGKPIVNLTKENTDLDDHNVDEAEKLLRQNESVEYQPFLEFVKEVMKSNIEKAVLGYRMVESPCCLTTSQYSWSANMERIMKAQALRDSSQSSYMNSKKILELNPRHPLVQEIFRRFKVPDQSDMAKNLVSLLFETASIVSGFSVEKPSEYGNRIYKMMSLGLNLSESDLESKASEGKNDSSTKTVETPAVDSEMETVD